MKSTADFEQLPTMHTAHPQPRQILRPIGTEGSYLDNVGKYSYRLGLRYDGTSYRGWQLQPGFPTIQAAIEHALSIILGEGRERLMVCAAGRTDRGVHATGQVKYFIMLHLIQLLHVSEARLITY